MERIEKYALARHPDSPRGGIGAVNVRLAVRREYLWLDFEVRHDATLFLTDHPHGRHDRLWHHTCFELFAKGGDRAGYVEYNFAPYAAWAAYDFHHRRHGMSKADVPEPHIVDCRIEGVSQVDREYQLAVTVRRTGLLARDDVKLGLSAVIENVGGQKSYWALAHPDGPPDFHDPACFVLQLPATG